jgi:hypothetical protein
MMSKRVLLMLCGAAVAFALARAWMLPDACRDRCLTCHTLDALRVRRLFR